MGNQRQGEEDRKSQLNWLQRVDERAREAEVGAWEEWGQMRTKKARRKEETIRNQEPRGEGTQRKAGKDGASRSEEGPQEKGDQIATLLALMEGVSWEVEGGARCPTEGKLMNEARERLTTHLKKEISRIKTRVEHQATDGKEDPELRENREVPIEEEKESEGQECAKRVGDRRDDTEREGGSGPGPSETGNWGGTCRFCERVFRTQARWDRHRNKAGPCRNQPRTGGRAPCNLCGKVLSRRRDLVRHCKHTHAFAQVCPECTKIFSERTGLKAHFKETHGNWNASIGRRAWAKAISQ